MKVGGGPVRKGLPLGAGNALEVHVSPLGAPREAVSLEWYYSRMRRGGFLKAELGDAGNAPPKKQSGGPSWRLKAANTGTSTSMLWLDAKGRFVRQTKNS